MPLEPARSKDHATIGDALIFIVKSLLAAGAIVLLVTGAWIWWQLDHRQPPPLTLEQRLEQRLLVLEAQQQRAMAESMRGQIAACLDDPCGCGPVLEDISRQLATTAQPPD